MPMPRRGTLARIRSVDCFLGAAGALARVETLANHMPWCAGFASSQPRDKARCDVMAATDFCIRSNDIFVTWTGPWKGLRISNIRRTSARNQPRKGEECLGKSFGPSKCCRDIPSNLNGSSTSHRKLLSVRRVAKRTGALFARLSDQTSQGECPAQCVPHKTSIIYRLLRSMKGKPDEPVGCRLRCRITFVAPLRRGFRVMRKEETLCIATSPRGTSHLPSRQTVTHSLCEASPSKHARYCPLLRGLNSRKATDQFNHEQSSARLRCSLAERRAASDQRSNSAQSGASAEGEGVKRRDQREELLTPGYVF